VIVFSQACEEASGDRAAEILGKPIGIVSCHLNKYSTKSGVYSTSSSWNEFPSATKTVGETKTGPPA